MFNSNIFVSHAAFPIDKQGRGNNTNYHNSNDLTISVFDYRKYEARGSNLVQYQVVLNVVAVQQKDADYVKTAKKALRNNQFSRLTNKVCLEKISVNL